MQNISRPLAKKKDLPENLERWIALNVMFFAHVNLDRTINFGQSSFTLQFGRSLFVFRSQSFTV
jgi:hypothetical protein